MASIVAQIARIQTETDFQPVSCISPRCFPAGTIEQTSLRETPSPQDSVQESPNASTGVLTPRSVASSGPDRPRHADRCQCDRFTNDQEESCGDTRRSSETRGEPSSDRD